LERNVLDNGGADLIKEFAYFQAKNVLKSKFNEATFFG
jgi:hypothetical protein